MNAFLIRSGQRLCEMLFLLPVFLVPLVFASFTIHTIVIKETVFHYTTAYCLFALPLLWFFNKRSTIGSIARNRMMGSFVFTLVILAVYLFFSYFFISSHPRSFHMLVRWMAFVLLTLVSIEYAACPRRFQLYLFVNVITAALVSAYAILQVNGIEWFLEWPAWDWGVGAARRVNSSLGNPDFLAGYLVALAPVTLIFAIVQRGGWRVVLSTVFLMEVAALLFSYSRGGWLTLYVTFLILFAALTYVNWARDPVLLRAAIGLRTAGAVLIGCAVLGAVLIYSMWSEVEAALYRFSQLGEGASVATRPYFWEGAYKMTMDRPLTGFGLGMFAVFFPQYRAKDLTAYLPFKEWFVEHAHNEYLEITSEMGLIGLALFAIVIVLTILIVWNYVTRRRARENLVLLGLLGGIVGILLHNMVTVTLRHTPTAFLLWSFIGVSVGYATRPDSGQATPITRSRLWPLPVYFAGALFLLIMATRFYVGDCMIEKGGKNLSNIRQGQSLSQNRRRMEESLVMLHRGRRYYPDCVRAYTQLGLAYSIALDFPQARNAFQELDNLQKRFTSTAMNLCITCLKLADYIGSRKQYLPPDMEMFISLALDCTQEAKTWILKAIDDDPHSPSYYHLLGRCELTLGALDAAETAFQKAIRLESKRNAPNMKKLIQDNQHFLDIIQNYRSDPSNSGAAKKALDSSPSIEIMEIQPD